MIMPKRSMYAYLAAYRGGNTIKRTLLPSSGGTGIILKTASMALMRTPYPNMRNKSMAKKLKADAAKNDLKWSMT